MITKLVKVCLVISIVTGIIMIVYFGTIHNPDNREGIDRVIMTPIILMFFISIYVVAQETILDFGTVDEVRIRERMRNDPLFQFED